MNTNKRAHLRGFLLGVAMTVMVMGMAVPALADTVMKDIRVAYGGISIYVDGNLQRPTDATGKPVEAMIYDGTTYLPVRALTNMLTDKAVNWDGDTRSVYIGTMPKAANVGLEQINVLGTGKPSSDVRTGAAAKFKVLEKEYSPNNALFERSGYDRFLLNSEYKELHAYFTRRAFGLGNTDKGEVRFYSYDSHGTQTLLKEYIVRPGDDPIEVSVDLYGVNYLSISIRYVDSGISSDHRGEAALYDIYLTPAN